MTQINTGLILPICCRKHILGNAKCWSYPAHKSVACDYASLCFKAQLVKQFSAQLNNCNKRLTNFQSQFVKGVCKVTVTGSRTGLLMWSKIGRDIRVSLRLLCDTARSKVMTTERRKNLQCSSGGPWVLLAGCYSKIT